MKKRKKTEHIKLPAGCSMSKPVIHPKNWKQVTASLNEDWYIFYRFYDPVNKPGGKQRQMKGMNAYRTIAERRQATQHVLSDEMALLKSGYNPVTDSYAEKGLPGALNEWTPLNRALHLAYAGLSCAEVTKGNIRSMLNWIPIATEQLGIAQLPASEVKKKHIRLVLDQCAKIKSRLDTKTGEEITVTWSNDKFNKYRAYLMILFSEMVELEAIDQNPCRDLKVKKKVKRKRQVLSELERSRVDAVLRWFAYDFWRFLHIFFHSGARESEILALQGKHVTLEKNHFIRLVKKGKAYEEKDGTIKDIVLPLWIEAMEGCGPEDYIFSKGLRPGPFPIRYEQINRRWRLWVKGLLGITADFYSLKHLNTTQTARIAGDEAAAAHNAHKGTAMVVKIYDVERGSREHEAMKKVNNPFAGS